MQKFTELFGNAETALFKVLSTVESDSKEALTTFKNDITAIYNTATNFLSEPDSSLSDEETSLITKFKAFLKDIKSEYESLIENTPASVPVTGMQQIPEADNLHPNAIENPALGSNVIVNSALPNTIEYANNERRIALLQGKSAEDADAIFEQHRADVINVATGAAGPGPVVNTPVVDMQTNTSTAPTNVINNGDPVEPDIEPVETDETQIHDEVPEDEVHEDEDPEDHQVDTSDEEKSE
jgi:hypothetical protein